MFAGDVCCSPIGPGHKDAFPTTTPLLTASAGFSSLMLPKATRYSKFTSSGTGLTSLPLNGTTPDRRSRVMTGRPGLQHLHQRIGFIADARKRLSSKAWWPTENCRYQYDSRPYSVRLRLGVGGLRERTRLGTATSVFQMFPSRRPFRT